MLRAFYSVLAPRIRNWTSAVFAPAAAANTAGAPVTATPTPGRSGLVLIESVAVTFAGTFGAETATAIITATFSDGTNAVWSVATGAPGVLGNSSNDIAALMRDNTLITRVSVALQSTIANSQVTATARVIAVQV